MKNCTAVKGCTHDAALLSWKRKGRTYRICHMHLARWTRTGELGTPHARKVGVNIESWGVCRNTNRSAKALAAVVNAERLTFELKAERGGYRTAVCNLRIPSTQMTSWRTRGWASLQRSRSGEPVCRVTAAGAQAARGAV